MAKEITTVIVATVLILALLAPFASYRSAADPGDGPILIFDLQGLQDIQNDLSAHYVLNNSIDASDSSGWNGGAGFEPIGNEMDIFTGTFDGNGHTINGLFIDRTSTDCVGLFGRISGTAEIKDVGLMDADVSGRGWVGALVGYSDGTVNRSYSTGKISGDWNVGGLIGYSNGMVNQSYSSGEVSGNTRVGGLVGQNFNSGTITESYAIGEVRGYDDVAGGLVGYNHGTVSGSYASGHVIGNTHVGGLVGHNEGSVDRSYWDNQTTEQTTSVGGEGRTTDEMMRQSTFADWDFDGVWWMADNETRPFLRMEWSTEIRNSHQLQLMAMDRDSDYVLMSDIDLADVKRKSGMWGSNETEGKGFLPIGHLTMDDIENDRFHYGLNGTFSGNGYEISGLYVNRPGDLGGGLFVFIGESGQVSDLHMVGVDITAGIGVGGLAGANLGDVIGCSASGVVNGTLMMVGGLTGVNLGVIESSSSSVEVKGEEAAGGLVGMNEGSISKSDASGDVRSAAVAGGLAGINNGSISKSHASGNVLVTDVEDLGGGLEASAAGGLVGMNVGELLDCSASGDVSGAIAIGGLAAMNVGTIVNCSASGRVHSVAMAGGLLALNMGNVSDSRASGDVLATGSVEMDEDMNVSMAGGLIGFNFGNVSDSQASGDVQGISAVGGLVAINMGLINNSHSIGDVRGEVMVGGLLAANMGQVNGSCASGKVEATGSIEMEPGMNITAAGGLAGVNMGILAHSHFHGASVKGADGIGGLAGMNMGSIDQCSASGDVEGNLTVGGLVGLNIGEIEASHATGSVKALAIVGGLVGQNLHNVSGSYATGAVEAAGVFRFSADVNNSAAGGLIGFNMGNVSWSSAHGDVAGISAVGGLAGINVGMIEECHSTGEVSGEAIVGGLVAFAMDGSVTGSYATGDVTATGTVIAPPGLDLSVAGGLMAINGGLIDACYATGAVDGISMVAGLVAMNMGIVNNSFASGHVSAEWALGGLVGVNTDDAQVSNSHASGSVTARGSTADPYGGFFDNVSYAGGLVGINFKGSIDLSYSTGDVSGLYAVGGLVGYNSGNISGSHALGDVQGWAGVGGLVAINEGGIEGSYSAGDVTASGAVATGDAFMNNVSVAGGLVALNDGDILDCHALGDVQGMFLVGGLAALNEGVIEHSYSRGDAIATGTPDSEHSGNLSAAGGLVGHNQGLIERSFASGDVHGYTLIGGLAGQNFGLINNSYAMGSVTAIGALVPPSGDEEVSAAGGLVGLNGMLIANSYSVGAVLGEAAGGLVGYELDLFTEPEVTSSFWDMQTSGLSVSAGGDGITTEGMRTQATFTDASWDFDEVWTMVDGRHYPLLQGVGGTVVDVGILTQPSLTYDFGEALDLSIMEAVLTWSDGFIEAVPFSGFVVKGLEAEPEVGTALDHGHSTVTVTHAPSGESGQSAPLTVNPIVTAVGIEAPAVTTVYDFGEPLDLTGLTLNLTWSNGSSSVLPWDDPSLSSDPPHGFPLTHANSTVTVTHTVSGHSDSFGITVNTVVIAVEVDTIPDVTVYNYNDAIDLSGFELRLIWSDGSSSVIAWGHGSLATDPVQGHLLTHDDTTVTATHTPSGQQDSFDITVNRVVLSVWIQQQPRLSYEVGEALDFSGMQVNLLWSDTGNQTVAFADFAGHGLTASLLDGAAAELTMLSVTVTHAPSGGSATSGSFVITALPDEDPPDDDDDGICALPFALMLMMGASILVLKRR